MSIITRNQITIINVNDGDPGPAGPRGASSIGLGLKMNYSTFTAVNPGEVYLHGYDDAGNPADIDGFIYYQDTRLIVLKRMVNPNVVIDGYLVLECSSGAAYVAGYDYLQNQFKIRDASFGMDGYVIDSTGWVCIGRMKNDSTENTVSAILYERAVDMTAALRTVFSEVIFGKAEVTQAEFDAILQYTQTQFFNRLAVNTLFVNDLVGNTAFIDSLITDDAFIQDATVRQLVIEETVDGVTYTIHIDKDHGIELTVDGVTKFHASPSGSLIARDASLINSSVSGIFTSPEFSTQKAGAAGSTNYAKSAGDQYLTLDYFSILRSYLSDHGTYDLPTDSITMNCSGQFGTQTFSSIKGNASVSRSMDALSGQYISNGVLYLIKGVTEDPFPPLMSTNDNLGSLYAAVSPGFVANASDGGTSIWDNTNDAFIHFVCDDLIAQFSSLPVGTSMPFTGSFSLTYDTNSYYNYIDGPTLQTFSISSTAGAKYSILLGASAIEIYDPNGVFLISISDTTRATNCSVNISVESVKEGIKVKNVMPSADNTYLIGDSSSRFKEVHGVNIYGTVNSPGTTKKVYGAVAN